MRALLYILFFVATIVSCNNENQTPQQSGIEKKYDVNTDTSLHTGEMKRYWLVLLQKRA